MIKGVITDLDGTLLDKNHFLSEYTKDIINQLLDKGLKFYIATGRVERGARLVADQFNKKIPLITTNGARLVDCDGNELLSVKLSETCKKILLDYDYTQYDSKVFINGYSTKDWLVVSENYKDFYHKRRLDKTFSPNILTVDEFKKRDFNKIFFVGEYDALYKIREDLRKLISDYAHIDFVSKNSLEVYDKSVNKGIAAEYILQKDNISLDEVLCFGDGLNDYEMLKRIKHSYIMDNALEELKEKLPNLPIIDNNHTDSVARKIKEVFNL